MTGHGTWWTSGAAKRIAAAGVLLGLAGCAPRDIEAPAPTAPSAAEETSATAAGAPWAPARLLLGRWWVRPGDRIYLGHDGKPDYGALRYKFLREGVSWEASLSRGLMALDTGLYSTTYAPMEPGGYAVELWSSGQDGKDRLQARAAVTVTANPLEDVRMGFYSNFHAVRGDYAERARLLAEVGVNATEFYDYFPAHGEYAPRERTYHLWQDMTVDDVNEKVSANRARGILSIAYVAAYSATAKWFERFPHPMTNAAGEPLKCGPDGIKPAREYEAKGIAADYHIMAIHPGSPWREHVIDQFVKAVTDGPEDLVHFDGIEVDSYGHGGEYYAPGFSPAAGAPRPTIDAMLADVVRDAKSRFPQGRFAISNTIGGEAAGVFASAVDFQFMEFWPWYFKDYAGLGRRLYESRAHRSQRVVFKLYPDSMEPKAKVFEAETLRLLMGVGLATGSSLMIAGEPDPATGELRGLQGPFYPTHEALAGERRAVVRAYNLVDALLFGYTHGSEVSNCTECAAVLEPDSGVHSYGFAFGSGGRAGQAATLLRVGPDTNWTRQAEPRPALPPQTVRLKWRQQGFGVQKALFVSPDDAGWEVPLEVPMEVRGDDVFVQIPELRRFGCVILLPSGKAGREG